MKNGIFQKQFRINGSHFTSLIINLPNKFLKPILFFLIVRRKNLHRTGLNIAFLLMDLKVPQKQSLIMIIIIFQQYFPQFGSIRYHYLTTTPLVNILQLEFDGEELYLHNSDDQNNWQNHKERNICVEICNSHCNKQTNCDKICQNSRELDSEMIDFFVLVLQKKHKNANDQWNCH